MKRKVRTSLLPRFLNFGTAIHRPDTQRKPRKSYLPWYKSLILVFCNIWYATLVCPLTPPPIKNRQTRLNINPTFPPTNLFTNPNPRTDRGRRTAKGITAALNLSSGYHTPLRILRHLITVKSEIRPTMADPTLMWLKRVMVYLIQSGRDLRTHATNTYG